MYKSRSVFVLAAAVTLTAAAVMLVSTVTSPALAGGGHNPNPGVVPPDSRYCGMTYGQWSAAWTQWALSTTEAQNPVLDTTGEYAHIHQWGPVFFLAGTFGGPPVTRNVTVGTNKAFFFPISCWGLTYPEDVPADLVGHPRQALAWMRDTLNEFFATEVDPNDLKCEVDGVPVANLERYRVRSPVYPLYLAPGSIEITLWNYEPGWHYPNVSDGYWLMLAPLSAGNHVVHIQWEGYLEVTYNLTVQRDAE